MRTIIPNSQYLCNYAVRWCTWSTYLGLAWYSVMVVKATSLLNTVASGVLGRNLLSKLLAGRRGSPDICWPASTHASAQRLFLQPAPSFRSLEGHGPSCLWAFAHINSSVWIIPASFHLINWDSSWLKVHFLLLDPPSRSFSKKCVPWPWIVYLMCVLSCSALSYSLWPHGR